MNNLLAKFFLFVGFTFLVYSVFGSVISADIFRFIVGVEFSVFALYLEYTKHQLIAKHDKDTEYER